jgi:hypothetical protein
MKRSGYNGFCFFSGVEQCRDFELPVSEIPLSVVFMYRVHQEYPLRILHHHAETVTRKPLDYELVDKDSSSFR